MIRESLEHYQQQLSVVDEQILNVVQSCEAMSEKAGILNSCPGVGPATVGLLLAELPELGTLSRGKTAKLVGVAPMANDSGTKEGRRKTHAGRGAVRKTLYMAALVCTRYNAPLRAFYQRLLARGKQKKVAIVAVMRKLLVILNTMIKNQEIWKDTAFQS